MSKRKRSKIESPVRSSLSDFAISGSQLKAELCRRSFKRFIQEFWSEIVPEPLVWNWHMDLLCLEMEILARRVFGAKTINKFGCVEYTYRQAKEYDLLFNVPPGTTKSLICSVMFHPWCWTNDPTLRFISGSYSSFLSLEHSDLSRDIIKSDKYRAMYPDIEIRRDKDNKSLYTNNHKGGRYTTSVGGTITGFHAHFILVDDPINPKQAASDLLLTQANNWVKQTLSTRKIDKAVTPTIMIMQRLSEKDPSATMMVKDKVRHICLPGEIFDKKTQKSVKPPCAVLFYKDKMLDPVRMGRSVLSDLEADLGQYGYAGQIRQSPSPPTGGMFKTYKIDVVDSIPDFNIIEIVRYWDKAGTDIRDNPGSAHTAGVKIAKLRDSKYLYAILDVKRGQLEAYEREELVKQTAKLDGKKVRIWIEQEPGSGGKESAQSTIRNLAGFTVNAERPIGDKVYRADPFSVQVNWGNVCMLSGAWNQDFIDEMSLYPVGKLKDQIDASSGAFNKLSGGNRAGTWRNKK